MDCPFGVDITKMFSIYNGYVMSKNGERFLQNYDKTAEEERLDKCQQCGACMAQCPQHIQIPDQLAAIGSVIDDLRRA